MKTLTMSDRICLCNLCVEAGAKTALMEVDDVTLAYLAEHGGRKPAACFASDPDAEFEKTYEIDLSRIVPVVAKPHFVDNLAPVSEVGDVKINEAFLGSCNNGRIEDLRLGASIIKGRKVADKIRFLVVPASQEVYRQALKEGLLDIFMEAGAMVMNPNCSVCWGSCQGVIGAGEVLISTGTRNFKGRAGDKNSFVYLGSAATVAASAIAGEIVSPYTY
jgi:3-isopropylmalate/(R)-2-methylmalate dehydratase large subunit